MRYLCEFNAQDAVLDLDRLAVPALLLEPGLEDHWHEPGRDYMSLYCHGSWEGRPEKHAKMQVRRVPGSRVCLWLDRPQEVYGLVAGFLDRLE